MRKVTAAAVAATMLLTTGVAMAASASDIKLDGDLKVHYRWNTAAGDPDYEGGKVWFRLNATAPLSDNVDVYTRLSMQTVGGDLVGGTTPGADFDTSYGKYNNDGLTVIDRLGFVVKSNDWKYTIGRQGVTLGPTALLYSTEGYTGINMGAIDGVVATGKSGATNLKVVVGKQWSDGKDYDNKVYAVEASYSPAKDWTVGAVVGKVKFDQGEAADLLADYGIDKKSSNHWAVNAGYTLGKANFAAEYGKSNFDELNTAYAAVVNYAFDTKHSAYVNYSKINVAGDMVYATDWDNNGKGIGIGYDYKLRQDTTFSLFYKDMKTIIADGSTPAGSKYDSFRATVTYKF